jgi:RNA polymerase sigma factor (sigma-70 family)
MKRYSNDEYIRGILEHDEVVLRHIYNENFRKVTQLVCTNNGNSDEAADVFQDAILVIYNKVKEGKLILTASFETYLYAVAKMVWKAEYRRKTGRMQDGDSGKELISDIDVQQNLIQNEKFKLVWFHFDKLTSNCQKVIRMVLDGLSIQEITEQMNFSTDQHTKNRRLRCKESLMKSIIKDPRYKELTDFSKNNDQFARW